MRLCKSHMVRQLACIKRANSGAAIARHGWLAVRAVCSAERVHIIPTCAVASWSTEPLCVQQARRYEQPGESIVNSIRQEFPESGANAGRVRGASLSAVTRQTSTCIRVYGSHGLHTGK